jgi:hypothetical protein
MRESEFMQRVRLAFGRGATRIFRCNAGQAWIGKTLHRDARAITIGDPRPFHGMPPGTSDLIGWHSVTVTPEMVGQRVALFLAIETKAARGRATAEQSNFVDVVNAAGGIGVIARTEAEIAAALHAATAGRPDIASAPADRAAGR